MLMSEPASLALEFMQDCFEQYSKIFSKNAHGPFGQRRGTVLSPQRELAAKLGATDRGGYVPVIGRFLFMTAISARHPH